MNAPLLPAILHSTLTGLTVGGSYGLGSGEKIENPYETPILIDEIRFHTTGKLIDYLRCKLEFGQQPLTADYLPIDMFGKTLNWEGQYVKDPASNDPLFSTAVWRLPKPLLLPADARLTPKFKFQDDFGASPATQATIHFTCAGRRLPTGFALPSALEIPFIAHYHAVVNGGDAYQSSESDLKNPFPQKLNIERLLFGFHVNNGTEDSLLAQASVDLDTALTNVTIRMHDSLGAIVLRDQVAIGDLITPLDRSWPLNTELRSGAYYVVDGEIAATNATNSNNGLWLALHGTRTVELADIGG